MHKKYIIIALLALTQVATAQDTTGGHGLLKNFGFAFPSIAFGWSFPFRDKSVLQLPAGQGLYFYYTSTEFSGFWFNNLTKITGLYYKDKIGIEISYGMYGPGLSQLTYYNNYLHTAFPGYYKWPTYDPETTDALYFSGFFAGPVYRRIVHKFAFSAALFFGFDNVGDQNESYNYQLKQAGSNHFINYNVGNDIESTNFPATMLQLTAAKRLRNKNTRVRSEIGCQVQYLYLAYRQTVSISQQPDNGATTYQNWTSTHAYNAITPSVYFTAYFSRKTPLDKYLQKMKSM